MNTLKKTRLGLLILILFLGLSVQSYAVTAPQEKGTTIENHQLSRKEKTKVKRLKKILAKIEAKQQKWSSNSEEQKINKLAKRSNQMGGFGVLMIVIGVSVIPILGKGLLIASSLLGILGLFYAGAAMRAIKRAKNPKKYNAQKKKAKSGILTSTLCLIFLGLALGALAALSNWSVTII